MKNYLLEFILIIGTLILNWDTISELKDRSISKEE